MECESCGEQCGLCGLIPIIPGLNGATRVVARSDGMRDVLRRTARFAASDAPVAVVGETGTGKEVVARMLHLNSKRAEAPFVAVNVAALPAELLETELFGHAKGAFTGAVSARHGLFETAHGGTLFLDEIGEMPQPLQAKLLRVLQDGEVRRVGENQPFAVNVRVISATHRDLAQRVADGLFREDLYYRLKVLTLHVPPLRERVADILPLAGQLLARETNDVLGFSERAKERLLGYGWPGNVRELANVVKHGAALATGAEVDEDDLPEEFRAYAPPRLVRSSHGSAALRSLVEVERDHILNVLDECEGSQSEAARVLGIARNTLWRKLRMIRLSA